MANIDELKNRGFDLSYYDATNNIWIAKCSYCTIIMDDIARHGNDFKNVKKVKKRQNRGKANRLRQEKK